MHDDFNKVQSKITSEPVMVKRNSGEEMCKIVMKLS